MGEHQQVANKYQGMDFDELADAPLEAVGLASSDAAALKQALGSPISNRTYAVARRCAGHALRGTGGGSA
jgi:hypothetical protein